MSVVTATEVGGEARSGSRPVLCLGEALVDLICERSAASIKEADAFMPHFGGAVANVALMAARAGARTALAGGAGDDDWGRWLNGQLERAGVGLEHFKLIDGLQTPLAMTTVDAAGEPTFTIYGEGISTVVHAIGDSVEAAVAASGGLFISSNTLVGEAEHEITMRARRQALAVGHPVIFDPNLRLHRWKSTVVAVDRANACVPQALLVRCNAAEARLMTGEENLELAAAALRTAGARNVVITAGARGAMLRGKIRLNVSGTAANVISTVGAGDTLMATLIARLQITGFYEPAIAAALPEAVAAAARACERWGACD